MWRLPPSALKPAAAAIASTSVDFPLPFSPANSVTRESRSSVSSWRIAGIENGYSLKSSTSSPSGSVSYGLAIHNERVRFDATNVDFLVNFVDASNRVLGTDHVAIARIPAGATVYHGARVSVPYASTDPVTRLETVLVSATSAQKVPSTPLLVSDMQAAPSVVVPGGIDSIRGQILNPSKLQMERADVGVLILDPSGKVIGGGSAFAQGPLSRGSREFFSSCCSYSDIQLSHEGSILVSAVPTYQTSTP